MNYSHCGFEGKYHNHASFFIPLENFSPQWQCEMGEDPGLDNKGGRAVSIHEAQRNLANWDI